MGSPSNIIRKLNVIGPNSSEISEAVTMNSIKHNKPILLIAKP